MATTKVSVTITRQRLKTVQFHSEIADDARYPRGRQGRMLDLAEEDLSPLFDHGWKVIRAEIVKTEPSEKYPHMDDVTALVTEEKTMEV
jgi:hypothetical protein